MLVRLATVLLLCAAPLLGQSVREADALLRQGQAQAALEMLAKLPPEEAVLTLRADALYRSGRHFEAVEEARQALQADPDNKRANQVAAASLFALRRLEEAIPFIEKVREWFPDDPNFLDMASVAYIHTRQADPARRAIAEKFGLQPDSAAAYLITGRIFREGEIWTEAESVLSQALKLDSRLPMAHLYLGETLMGLNRHRQALSHFEEEIEINPAMWMGYYRKAEALMELGRDDEAFPLLERSIQLNRFFAGPFYLIGQIMLRRGEVQEAIAHLQRSVELDYANSRTHFLLGRALLLAGRQEEAEKEFELSRQLKIQENEKRGGPSDP